MTTIFGSGPAQPAAPEAPKPPPTMPDNQSPAVLEAARKARQEAEARAGRSSTILSQAMKMGSGSGAAAGMPGSYSSTKTGAAA